MDGTRSRSTVRFLDVIAVILIIMATALTYMYHNVDFTNITEPFEKLSSMAQEQFPHGESSNEAEEERTNVVETITSTAGQMKDDLGLSKAQVYYIKFKTFMENLEQKVTELPYKPLIVLAILLFFTLKTFVAVVPVSATCLIAAVIFPFPVALIINLVGVGIIFTIRWAMGRKSQSSALKRLIMKSDNLWRVVSDADHSTAKVLKESSDKRKAEKEALDTLRQEEALKEMKETEGQFSLKLFFAPKVKTLRRGINTLRDKLLHVPVLSIVVGDEDPEKSAQGGTGNPIILFALRLIPFFPANPVSRLFGNMQMDYHSFIVISLLGYLLKIISFTAIGYNISDPFSSQFIVPIILLLYIGGFSLFGVNAILKYVDKRNAEREKEEAKKEKQAEQKA